MRKDLKNYEYDNETMNYDTSNNFSFSTRKYSNNNNKYKIMKKSNSEFMSDNNDDYVFRPLQGKEYLFIFEIESGLSQKNNSNNLSLFEINSRIQ